MRRRYLFLLVCVALIVLCALLFRSKPDRFTIVPNRNFDIAADATFGTNHVYSFGSGMVGPLELAWERLKTRDAYRLRYHTAQPTTVIWVRLIEKHKDGDPLPTTTNALVRFPVGGPGTLQARLISTAGGETILQSTRRTAYLHPPPTRQGHAEGWVLHGPLEDERGSVIHIETPEGIPIGTLKIP